MFVCGLLEVVPLGGLVTSSKRKHSESNEVERTSKAIYKDKKGACSSQFTKKHKAEEFVDKNTGFKGHKEEVKLKSSVKFDDKKQGCNTEYQTEVKFKKVMTYANKGCQKAGYKRINYNKRKHSESNEVERTSKAIYKDKKGACSSQFTKKHKAEEFVDKNTGFKGHKEEVKLKSSVKFDDKKQGCNTEYQTEVKFKKVMTYANKGCQKAGYKRINYK
ncbi:unnamed protein product [Ilex paraguariensis]|uniref:Uncharacterized protein n=1 Tax=Ilex paraguariensis TaxID=185542 RepID=A0ABC8SHI0_9AQUA